MKKILMFCLPWMLTACVGSVEEVNVDAIPTTEAFVVVDVDFRFDNKPTEKCFLNPSSEARPKGLDVIAKDTYRLRVMRIPNPGKFLLSDVSCLENKILGLKNRRKIVNPPLAIQVEPGTITYPGTIVADWESEGFGLADVITGGGNLTEDEGSLVMKREDRSVAIKALLEGKNAKWLKKFKFVTKGFESNKNLQQ